MPSASGDFVKADKEWPARQIGLDGYCICLAPEAVIGPVDMAISARLTIHSWAKCNPELDARVTENDVIGHDFNVDMTG